MRVDTRRRPRSLLSVWIVFVCSLAGCHALESANPGPARSPVSAEAASQTPPGGAGASSGPIILEAPQSLDPLPLVETPSRIETWVVHTRACEQKLGVNPWPTIGVARLDESGGPLHGTDPQALLERMATRPSVFYIHGNNYTYRQTVKEAVVIRRALEANGGLAPDTLFVIFDWPSERVLLEIVLDLNEKARRSRVASYQLARFLRAAPPHSRICLMGQSDGGRVALTTLHLLSGAPLRPFWSEPEVQLDGGRPDLRLRAVVLDAAAAHHWFNPGDRLDQTMVMCEALLNLRNCADPALTVYMLGRYTGLRPAVGQVGFLESDLKRLGPLAARIEQTNVYPMVGVTHTSFPEALIFPELTDRIARYTSWSDKSGL